MKFKKGTAAIYVLALMLVTAGYWAYLSNESKTLETVNLVEFSIGMYVSSPL